jgi:hypothetical protein
MFFAFSATLLIQKTTMGCSLENDRDGAAGRRTDFMLLYLAVLALISATIDAPSKEEGFIVD